MRTVAEYEAAAKLLDTMVLRSDLSAGEQDYVEALSVFIEDFDRRNNVFDTSGRTPLDMLRHLMEANDWDVTARRPPRKQGNCVGNPARQAIAQQVAHVQARGTV